MLETLEKVAAGDSTTRLSLSPLHDELDAIAFGINVLADELRWAHARTMQSERAKANEVRAEALRRSDANFATAFHSNPCAMTIRRVSDARLLDVNASFVRMTGFLRDEVIGRTFEEAGLWMDPEDVAVLAAARATGGRLRNHELRFRRKDGTPALVDYSMEIIHFNGELCSLGVGMDITDRRNAEIQAAALRQELAHLGRVTLIDVLSGSLAHEISQPLTAVMANAEAAQRLLAARRTADLADALSDIVADSRRARDVLVRMRSLLKNGTTEYEPVEVNNAVSDVVKMLQGNAHTRRITVDVELEPQIEPVIGDRIQIQQVVLNLLMNAFDAVEDQQPADRTVRLKTIRQDNIAVIEVSDRGTGLSDDALARLFEPFYTTKRDGMGLGLSISRTLVTAHGGTLRAERNPAGGMTFSAHFPMLALPEPDREEMFAAGRWQVKR